MKYVTLISILFSATFVLISIPKDTYFMNQAIYTLLFAIVFQLNHIYKEIKRR